MAMFPSGKTVHFGAAGYSDFTDHHDEERKQRYLDRHSDRENWTAAGSETAGFLSRWLLWNKQTLAASVRDTNRRFGTHFVLKVK
jgi:hypothetical protein